jgi:hypothetical protein
MGAEAICEAKLGRVKSRGKAWLETAELIFRGDFRARVPFQDIEHLTVTGDALAVTWPGGTLTLALGAAAPKWAAKIKNPPSRMDKLGVKPRARVALVGAFDFDPTFAHELAASDAHVAAPSSKAAVDVLFFAPAAPPDLERIPSLAKRLCPAGGLWIVRPKGKDTPITETETRKAGLAAALVDVKVAAFSPTHSALKFVIPLAKRRV